MALQEGKSRVECKGHGSEWHVTSGQDGQGTIELGDARQGRDKARQGYDTAGARTDADSAQGSARQGQWQKQ